MPTAFCCIRDQPVYRRDSFIAGLRACGYAVEFGCGRKPSPGDCLIIWNRYGENDRLAQRFEATGNAVIVAENSPLGREWRGGIWYTLCLGHHNASGNFPEGGPERWDGWNIGLADWRTQGDHILVLPQRGIGVAPFRQPDGWREQVLAWLAKRTKRPVRVREHPGTAEPRPVDKGLARDLGGAHCVVTWGSGAALKALSSGTPVFTGYPQWIGAGASLPFGSDLERPFLGDRLPTFQRLAWCMWSLDEIAAGVPFRRLLSLK